MSNSQSNEEFLQKMSYSILELQGLLSANNTILHPLLSIVCENAPQLIDSIKNKIDDVADLKIAMNELTSSVSKNAFELEIKGSLQQFDLIRESSKYSTTFINISDKK